MTPSTSSSTPTTARSSIGAASSTRFVRDFARDLPEGFLTLEERDGGRTRDPTALAVRTKNGIAVVPLAGEPPFGLDLAAAIASVLPPEFEARAFRRTLDSDTHCYLVRPQAWWEAFRAELPARYEAIFAVPSELPNRFAPEG